MDPKAVESEKVPTGANGETAVDHLEKASMDLNTREHIFHVADLTAKGKGGPETSL